MININTMRKIVIAGAMVMATALISNSQVVVTESFDLLSGVPSNYLPNGWYQGKITGLDPNNYFDIINNTATLPNCQPRTGAGMLRYRSGLTASANSAYIVSKPYDLSGRGGSSIFSFWMYRDEQAAGVLDNIQVYINTVPTYVGATLLNENFTIAPAINRPCSNSPITVCPAISYNAIGWNQYTYTVPAGVPWNATKVFVIIRANSNFGRNIYLDDFSIDTYPTNQVYASTDMVIQNSTPVGKQTNDNWIIGIRMVVNGAASPYRVDSLNFNTNGSTNPCLDIVPNGAKLYYTGGNKLFDPANPYKVLLGNAAVCATNFTFFPFTFNPAFRLDNDTCYFWVTYDIANIPPATGGNCVDAEYIGGRLNAGAAGNGYKSPATATLGGCRNIDLAYCIPLYSVGTSWLNGSYTQNDYVAQVILNGEAGYPSINNNLNSVGPNIAPWNGGPAPFTVHPPDYEKFAAVPGKTTVLKADGVTNYTIQSQCGTWTSANYIAAWIDFNHDGVFVNTMAPVGEKILQSPNLAANGWTNANFSVPLAAYIGNTTLRVREVYATTNIDPCASATYGETEDYTVTIIPDCNILPGWRVWLGGFSDDWDVPQNWCGGVPTIGTDAAILPDIDVVAPGIQAPLYQPKIKANVAATTRKLRIEGPDTLTIDSYIGGSLTMADSLTIKNANSMVKVIDNYNGTMVISNGNIVNSNSYPFNGAFARARMQIVYTQAELLAKGLVAGDVINSLQFYINVRNSTQPYSNFNINYFYTTTGFSFAAVPAVWASVSIAGGNIYNGALNLTGGPHFVPAGGSGTITLNLSAPIIWNGSLNDLVLDICYDNASTSAADITFVTQTIGVRKVARVWGLAAGAPAGCALVPGSPGTVRQGNDFRPNVTFLFNRNYTKFPINLRGHLGNSGTFIAGNSIFTFNSVAIQQNIDGTSNTTFHELAVNNALHVRQNTAATVDDTLWLQAGRLLLNGRTLTLNNGRAGAINRTSGYLYSEDLPPAYGSLNWKIGSYAGIHTVPFIQISGAYIPFVYDVTAGTSDLTIATYRTPPNNLPMPTGVTSIGGYYSPFTADNSPNMVDRYWIISETGAGTSANITFNFAGNEATGVPPPYMSQRWSGAIWELPTPGQSSTATSNTSPGLTLLNTPWTLTTQPQPLPVQLLDFTARAEGKQVRLDWTTASESNNKYFEIERTVDNREYVKIGGQIPSQGNSTSNQEYTTYDDRPLTGKQYYRLKQVDANGVFRYYGPVAVTFGKTAEFNIVSVINSNANSITVVFNYDSSEPFSYNVMDATGRIVAARKNIQADAGINYLDISGSFEPGIYTVVLQNSSKVVSKKFFR